MLGVDGLVQMSVTSLSISMLYWYQTDTSVGWIDALVSVSQLSKRVVADAASFTSRIAHFAPRPPPRPPRPPPLLCCRAIMWLSTAEMSSQRDTLAKSRTGPSPPPLRYQVSLQIKLPSQLRGGTDESLRRPLHSTGTGKESSPWQQIDALFCILPEKLCLN